MTSALICHVAQAADSLEERLGRLEAPGTTASPAAATSEPVLASAAAPVAHAAEPKSEPKKTSGEVAKGGKKKGASKLSIEERLSILEMSAAESAAAAKDQAPKAATPAAAPAASADAKFELNGIRPVFKSADGKNELALRGMVQLDAANYFQDPSDQGSAVPSDHQDLGSGAVLRRVRFGAEGKFMQDFFYELRLEFGGTDAEPSGALDIARVGYWIAPEFRVHAGVVQPMMTLSDTTSAAETTFLERPNAVTTFLPLFAESRRAIEAVYQQKDALSAGDNIIISAAITGQKSGTAHSGSSLDDEGTQALGRIAYRVYSDDNTNIQFGVSGADVLSLSGTTPGTARTLRLRDRPEARVSGERLIDTSDIQSEGASMYGFEAGANFHNVYLAAEWYQLDVERDRDCALCTAAAGDPEFSGWYVEGTWVLTGEPRRYSGAGNGSIGAWSSPKPKELVGGGGMGAFEVAARYSTIDLNWNEGAAGGAAPTGGIRGGEQSIFAVGLNWYLNNNLRIMTDFQWVDVDRLSSAGADAGQDFEILQTRAQFAF